MAEPNFEVPAFMMGDNDLGKECITPEDTVVGADIAAVGYDPKTPLELLLTAIVAGYLSSTPNDVHFSVSNIMNMLRGAARGRPPKEDDALLSEIAWRVHVASFKRAAIPVRKHVRDALLANGYQEDELKRSVDGENADVRRLVSRFEREKEEWLARVTSQNDFHRMDTFRFLGKIFDAFETWNAYVGTPPHNNFPEDHKILFDRSVIRPTMVSGSK